MKVLQNVIPAVDVSVIVLDIILLNSNLEHLFVKPHTIQQKNIRDFTNP